MAIELNNVTGGYNISTINANFQKLEDALNGSLVWRNGSVAGETLMGRDLDMNSHEILNVKIGTSPNSLVTKGYVDAQDQLLSSKLSQEVVDRVGGDRALDSKIDLNFSRTLRAPESNIGLIPSSGNRRDSVLGFNSEGNPVPIYAWSETADLAIKLASTEPGLGADLVRHSGVLYPHEYGIDTTGKTDAGLALTVLWELAISTGKAIECRSGDKFLLNTSVKIPFNNARYSKAGYDRWFYGNGCAFYPGTAGMKMFMVSRPQVHMSDFRIINSATTTVPDPLVKGVQGVSAFYYGSLYDQDSMDPSQYEYMGFMYCTVDKVTVGGIEAVIVQRPGASPLDSSGVMQYTGAYYCTFSNILATECWYFNKQLAGLTSGNTSNRHRFINCQHQGGLCSFYGEPSAGGDCKIYNFLAEQINWTPRTTGTYTDDSRITVPSVFWAFYRETPYSAGFENTVLVNCNFEGDSASVPNYFMPEDGCVGIIPENVMSTFRGSLLGTGGDKRFHPVIRNDRPDSYKTFGNSLALNNPKSGIATGTYSNAAFNSRLRFSMYDGLSQFQLTGYQNKTGKYSGGSSYFGLNVWDFTKNANWTGSFGLPNKVRLNMTSSASESELRVGASLRVVQENDYGFTYTGSQTAGHILTFDSASSGLTFAVQGEQLIRPAWTNQISLGSLGATWKSVYTAAFSITSDGIIPRTNNTYDSGSTNFHVKDTYSQNAPIVVSDRNEKDFILPITDAVLDAWETVDFVSFKYKAAISEKGEDIARTHFGIIAQDIQEKFEEAGLDAFDYGILIYTPAKTIEAVTRTWDTEYQPAQEALYDVNGNIVQEELLADTVIKVMGGSEVVSPELHLPEKWMVRMEECLSLEAACQRRRLSRIEALLASGANSD